MSEETKEVCIDDIPIKRDYIDELKSELSYIKKFRTVGSSFNIRQRLLRKIFTMIGNKDHEPEKYDGLNLRRVIAYRKMRDLEYIFNDLVEIVEDIEQELAESWQEEDNEDIFNEEES